MKTFLLIFIFTSSGFASVLGEDNRLQVDKIEFPYTSIGRLITPGDNHCSASLVTSSKVLTAKHCVETFRGNENQFGIQFQDSNKVYRFKSVEVTATDVAYLTLTENIINMTPLKISDVQTKKILNLGYPLDLENGQKLHEERCTIRSVEYGFLINDCDVMRGQSGGPILNSQNEIIAINSFQSCGDLSHAHAPQFSKYCYSAAVLVK